MFSNTLGVLGTIFLFETEHVIFFIASFTQFISVIYTRISIKQHYATVTVGISKGCLDFKILRNFKYLYVPTKKKKNNNKSVSLILLSCKGTPSRG